MFLRWRHDSMAGSGLLPVQRVAKTDDRWNCRISIDFIPWRYGRSAKDDHDRIPGKTRGALAGCGGWSRRATLYGGNQTPGRDAALLDPATDAARVRAMYTHPEFKRRGVGRLVLELCE